MSLLGAISQVHRTSGLGTGVVALQLRTPPLHAMAAATLQQLAGDRDVFLGVGISSPAVAGQWHGAGYTDRPIAQVREFLTLLRECLAGDAVTFEGDFYSVKRFRLGVRLGDRKPKIALAALNKQMLRLGGELADVVLLNYLPASLVPWCVERIREGGNAEVSCLRALRGDRPRPLRRSRPQGSPQLRRCRRVREPVRARRLRRRSATSSVRVGLHAIADAAVAAISDDWVDAIQIMGDEDHVRKAVQAYADHGVDVPIVFALPWGEDRRATVSRDAEGAGLNASVSSRVGTVMTDMATFVLIHGAGSDSWYWHLVAPELRGARSRRRRASTCRATTTRAGLAEYTDVVVDAIGDRARPRARRAVAWPGSPRRWCANACRST